MNDSSTNSQSQILLVAKRQMELFCVEAFCRLVCVSWCVCELDCVCVSELVCVRELLRMCGGCKREMVLVGVSMLEPV